MQILKRISLFLACLAAVTLGFSSITVSNAASEAAQYNLVVHVPKALPKSAKISVALASDSNTVVSSSRAVGVDSYGWFGVVAIPAAAGDLIISATGIAKSSNTINPIARPEVWLDANGNPFNSKFAATGKVQVKLAPLPDSKIDRYIQIKAGNQTYLSLFSKTMTASVSLPLDTKEVTVKTLLKMGTRYVDTSLETTTDVSIHSDLFVSDFFEGVRFGAAHAAGKMVIHYKRSDKNYTGWTLNALSDSNFGGALKPNTFEKSQAPDSTKLDAWGVTFTVPLKDGTTLLPFIIHKGRIADPVDKDQTLDPINTGGEVWIESGNVDKFGKVVVSVPAPLAEPELPSPTLEQAGELFGETERSSFANDSIYFVMFDRYKNGDPTNDNGGLVGDVSKTGYLPTDWAYSHGGDLKGLADGCEKNDGSGDGIPRIKRLGFTAVWISPPFVQNFVQSGSSAYHGYFVTDFTKIDPHWGTNEDFKNVSDCAHRLGMKVILDIVVNHTGDIIQYGARADYNGQVNNTAYIPADMKDAKAPAFLNDLSNYHNMGPIKNWSSKGEYQNGDFGGLDDLKTEKQEVVTGFADVYSMWVNDYGVDGFRIDTAKHVDDQFFTRWWNEMVQKTQATMTAKGQKLFAFGEYYDGSTSTLSGYIHKQGLPSVLDFAFQPAAIGYAQGGDASGLANVFKADNNYLTSNKSAYNLINFLGNHDMGRAGYLLRGAMTLAELRKADVFAHDVMFLTRGIPSIFYGDEVGMLGGGDKAARQDMFSTMVKTWKEEERIWGDPIGIKTSYNVVTPLTTRLALLNKLRKDHPALASGAQILRLQSGSVMVNSRIDAGNRNEYVVAFNSGDKERKVTAQISTPSSTFTPLLGTGKFTSDATGKITITVPAKGTVVLKANKTLPVVTSSPKVYQTVSWSSSTETIRVTAAVRGTDPGQVTWLAKVNDGEWERVGTDDSTDFGMTWDYNLGRQTPIQSGDTVVLVAVYKNSSGGLSISKPAEIDIK